MAIIPGTPSDDTLYGSEGLDDITGLAGNDKLFGFGSNDILDGGDGNDLLDGGAGADTMTGGIGNDYYYVDDIGDLVVEGLSGGSDLVFSAIDYTLPDNVERLAALDPRGTAPLRFTGNSLDNEIIGNDGANVMIGGGGQDYLRGEQGDDTYIVYDEDARFGESAGGGFDKVLFAGTTSNSLHNGFDYSLPYYEVHIPKLWMINHIEQVGVYNQYSTNSVNLRGSLQADLMTGNNGINLLEGHAGNDTMAGYSGDDYYFVGEAGDTVVEQAGDGLDTVFIGRYHPTKTAAVPVTITSYILPENVERVFAGEVANTRAYDLTGNALDNEVSGNNGVNTIDGKGGNDILVGNGGADTFAFTTVLGANNVDRVLGFTVGSDKIALDDAIFGGLAPGALSASIFQRGTTAWQAQDADDRILYDMSNGTLYFDSDGTGAAAPIPFATLSDGLNLSAADFFVI